MQFSESTNKTGIYENFQDLTESNSTSYSAYKFARDANSALARYMFLAIKSSQKWQVDDTNFTDYPIITINLVSSQQDYPFTTDAGSNQIWTIDRVECKDSGGNWHKLDAYDEMSEESALSQTSSGTPNSYHQTANGIFLKDIPGYNSTDGLKVYFKRAPSYFTGTDTIKVPGIPEMFHEYLVYRPAYLYAVKNLPQLANGYLAIVQKIESDIADFYFLRNQNQPKNMIPAYHSTR